MGRKLGALPPFGGGWAGSPSNTKSPGTRPSSMPSGILIYAAIWLQKIWAKNWGLCPFRGGGGGSPSNTAWPGPRPTCMPSFILIRPTVWPQCSNVTDRQEDRQTNRHRSDSIQRTVLQTVAPKSLTLNWFCCWLFRFPIMCVLYDVHGQYAVKLNVSFAETESFARLSLWFAVYRNWKILILILKNDVMLMITILRLFVVFCLGCKLWSLFDKF